MFHVIVLLMTLGLVLGGTPDAFAQVDRPSEAEKARARAKAKQRTGEREGDVNRDSVNRENIDQNDPRSAIEEEDDDDVNAGAIVGGIAASAVVGRLAGGRGGGKGGGKGEADAKADAQDKAVQEASPAQIDSDKNGQYTRDEFTVALNKAFKTADVNADGTMTREEAVAAFGDRGGAYFDALDEEKTGSVKMATLESDVAQAFEWADANGDGSLTADERSDAAKELDVAEAAEVEEAKTPKKAGSPKKKLVKKAKRAL